MAKPVVVSLEGVESSFDHAKLDRARLYGLRKRLPLDREGAPCIRAALTADGLYLLQSGMTAQGYFDEAGRWLERSALSGLDEDGGLVEPATSTLGTAQVLTPVDPSEVLTYVIDAVHALDPIALDSGLTARLEAGEVFSFAFVYSTSYRADPAFLLKGAEGFFCLVGARTHPEWSVPGKLAVVQEPQEGTEDLDFEMF